MVCAVWSWIGCVVYELRMFLEKSGLKQSYGYKSHKQLNYKGDDGIPECNGGSREEGISVKSHMTKRLWCRDRKCSSSPIFLGLPLPRGSGSFMLLILYVSSCYCFGVRDIVSVVCLIVLSKGIKPFMYKNLAGATYTAWWKQATYIWVLTEVWCKILKAYLPQLYRLPVEHKNT